MRTDMVTPASLREVRRRASGRIATGPFRPNGILWRACCAAADRRRVRRVPPPVLSRAGGTSLTEEACLDPLALADPTRLYPLPPPVRPDVWETVDESDGVERQRLAFPSAAPFAIAVNDRVTVHVYRPARGPSRHNLLILHGIWRQDQVFEDRLCRELARAGVSSALLALPFHCERAPAGDGGPRRDLPATGGALGRRERDALRVAGAAAAPAHAQRAV